MTSSDMQEPPSGRKTVGASGPRSSQPKRRTFSATYKLEMIGKYDAATEQGSGHSRFMRFKTTNGLAGLRAAQRRPAAAPVKPTSRSAAMTVFRTLAMTC